MRTEQINIYKYDELSDEAKEKARDWWRDSEARSGDIYWSEYAIEDFLVVGAALGFKFRPDNSNGRPRCAVYFGGFSHQGSGASFDATWSASALNKTGVAAILADRPEAYTRDDKTERDEHNARLRPVLCGFLKLLDEAPAGSASVVAATRSHSLRVEWSDDDEDSQSNEHAETFKTLCEDFAAWLYRVLEAEYDYTRSDDAVAESITANDCEFKEDGTFYGIARE